MLFSWPRKLLDFSPLRHQKGAEGGDQQPDQGQRAKKDPIEAKSTQNTQDGYEPPDPKNQTSMPTNELHHFFSFQEDQKHYVGLRDDETLCGEDTRKHSSATLKSGLSTLSLTSF